MQETYTINDVLNEIRREAVSETQKGAAFERIMQKWFLTDSRYSNLAHVWLWEEFPCRKDLGGRDLGIDLVAKSDLGDYWAIQCKCYAEDAVIDKPAVDSFLANASRTFTNEETLQTVGFSNFVWVSTTRRWGSNAEEAIRNLSVPFNRIGLHDLEESTVDWHKLKGGIIGNAALRSGRTPFAYQKEAIAKARAHFIEQGHDRGKLIMACGTGKTYTALKILEDITPPNSLCLFLVPSIALLNQTLNAWMSDKAEEMRAICVCSDSRATRKVKKNDDRVDGSAVDLAVPATTNVSSVVRQLTKYTQEGKRVVIMSTYQSIDCVSEALREFKREVDLCICDEAHRTTGVKIKDEDESSFIKVHNNALIPASKRLYMTATPRLYREAAKARAKENADILCSMDDEKIYGTEFYRLSFNDAVSKGLLTDYKVLVLTVKETDLPKDMSDNIKARYSRAGAGGSETVKELNFDDATKLLGCVNALSKRMYVEDDVTWVQDPVVMRRAVAFCQTINPTPSNPNASSTQIAQYFGRVAEEYKNTLGEEEKQKVVNVKAQHIDGTMDANTRNEKIAWLKAESDDPNECRVLCNVRCLSEGVDVPALDAVLFLSPRNSEVEVVQSVGRVMRCFGKGTDKEKKYGYIIIPVIVPGDVTPEKALDDNKRFNVVWAILNALRSHDENFNAHVNQINLNKSRPAKIVVAGIPKGTYAIGQEGGDAVHMTAQEAAAQLDMRFGNLQSAVYARLVEKVGDKMYWENWSRKVGEIALKFIERIQHLIDENKEARASFEVFVDRLKENINPSVDTPQAIEMLAQHMITKPVFDALFENYEFVKNNIVSRSMQAMIEVLESQGFAMDTEVLDRFYTSVRSNVGNIDNLEGKQTIIKNLYEKFFKGAFPMTVDKLGIVYTPVECVDFIIRSVDDILKGEFKTALTGENVHILDPFTGTGTFISRLLQLGVIAPDDLPRKYGKEIHCNEIVLLAYYIADVNIESVYHHIASPEKYMPYNGICLTDTFQLSKDNAPKIFADYFKDNSERVREQMNTPVRVIIGNPPYSIGQKSANDNAQNLDYPELDAKVKETYGRGSTANNQKSLYDSYIKAFRWATDRIPQEEGGIVAFISNGSWLDSSATDGMRICLEKEYSSIYVLNLRGNQRTVGELSRKEGGKIFGSGSRTPITITFLVKNPAKKGGKAQIFYHDIGDYLSREEKLRRVREFRSLNGVTWSQITPNDKADWISQRDGVFDNLIALADKAKGSKAMFFNDVAIGVATNRDAWSYNFSKEALSQNIQNTIGFYNSERERYHKAHSESKVEDVVSPDENKISWTVNLKKGVKNNKQIFYNSKSIIETQYRPFTKQSLYYDNALVERPGQWRNVFPNEDSYKENRVICVNAVNSKGFSCLMVDNIPDLHYMGDTQCFPLYWYKKNDHIQTTLFGVEAKTEYGRRDGVTDWIVAEAAKRYIGGKVKDNPITKEHIFYYVYGILHSKEYRARFENDLKKSLPRIPLVESYDDFLEFYSCGRTLAALHLGYEGGAASPVVVVDGDRGMCGEPTEADYAYFGIADKMRFANRNDRGAILYNGNIRIEQIPEKAYEYIVNGKSAIEWIVERYCVSRDGKSGIANDCNLWAREHQNPRYILDLLLSVINISVQSALVIDSLPTINFDEAPAE